MNIDAEKRRVAEQVARAVKDPDVVSIAVVFVRRKGREYENRFSISPSPDFESRISLALGICGAAGTVAGIQMDPKQPSPSGSG